MLIGGDEQNATLELDFPNSCTRLPYTHDFQRFNKTNNRKEAVVKLYMWPNEARL